VEVQDVADPGIGGLECRLAADVGEEPRIGVDQPGRVQRLDALGQRPVIGATGR
jgi:hypothetical protein